MRIRGHSLFSVLALACVACPLALAQPDQSGIDMVRIGATNNPAYDGVDPLGYTRGRGSVGYEYHIGRYEVTSAQWVEFYNAALNRPDPILWVQTPAFWGGTRNSPTSGPFTVRSGGAMLPAGGMTWRTCAIYCNWLSNGKRADAASFMSGAYDVSTFGEDGQGGFTDQLAHSPGAAYWIPTFDEWIKDAHYDVDKPNDDGSTGGWWQYNITSDTAPRYGPPRFTNGNPLNQANAGFSPPGNREFSIPLGAYTEVTSPWGLYDTAGGTGEWLERAAGNIGRFAKGSPWGSNTGADVIWSSGGGYPGDGSYVYGLRLASTVPGSSSLIAIGACGILGQITRRRARHETCSPRRVLAASRRSLVSTSVVWLTPALFATLALA